MTCLRGHFIDKVEPFSEAEKAGLQQGDMLLEVNGIKVKDTSHEDLVVLIRNATEEEENLSFVVVSQTTTTETTVIATTDNDKKDEE